ncbi:mannose-1-phosphate guanylyltransferase [Candidatus Dependentiae bacterium]
MEVYFVILSGGGGKRLWPISRKKKPKQFLRFSGGKMLLESTIDRILPLLSDENRMGVVAPPYYFPFTEDLLYRNIDIFIREPEARNTAGAMLLSCARLLNKSCVRDSDPVIVFLPSDHVVSDDEKFRESLNRAVKCSRQCNSIVLLGVKPDSPKTGYGYVRIKDNEDFQECFSVTKFLEKPDRKMAKDLIVGGNVYWNTGIYVGRVSTIVGTAKEKAPQLWDSVEEAILGGGNYNSVPQISFDNAIAEKADNLMLVECDCGWNDVGNLYSFLSAEKENSETTKVFSFKGQGNLARAGAKTVVFCGTDDLCLVETSDVTLVVHKDSVEHVKDIVSSMEESDDERVLL